MLNLEIITDKDCTTCKKVKELLNSKKDRISYTEKLKDTLTENELQYLIKNNCKTLPILINLENNNILSLQDIVNF